MALAPVVMVTVVVAVGVEQKAAGAKASVLKRCFVENLTNLDTSLY